MVLSSFEVESPAEMEKREVSPLFGSIVEKLFCQTEKKTYLYAVYSNTIS